MVTKTFFRRVESIKEALNKELISIEESGYSALELSEYALVKIDKDLRTIKQMVSGFIFENTADEIYFFKQVKPYFISRYIYYSMLLNMEVSKPRTGGKAMKKYYDQELEKLREYKRLYQDFFDYYSRGATYLDYKYFVRNSYDLKMRLPLNLYNYDASFSTSHDQYISCFMAHERLTHYIISLQENEPFSKGDLSKSKLSWSHSKVSLIELIYALHHAKCFNHGNIDFSELVRYTERILSVDLKNVHKTIGEIKSRKNERTKFLRFLDQNLNQILLDLDQ